MAQIASLVKEMDRESTTTRRMLERVPEDKYEWQPHPKSMTIQQLTAHLAELPGWITMVLQTDELDFSKTPYQSSPNNNKEELMAVFENSLKSGKSTLERATEADLLPSWTLRNGEEIYSVSPKEEVVRMIFSQVVHHRAQLGVYLRLLDIPLPGSYGPTADEPF